MDNDTINADSTLEVKRLKHSLKKHGLDDAGVVLAELTLHALEIDKLRKSQADVFLQMKSLQEDLDTTRMKLDEKCKEARRQRLVINRLETQIGKIVQQHDTLKSKEKVQREVHLLPQRLKQQVNTLRQTEKVLQQQEELMVRNISSVKHVRLSVNSRMRSCH